MKIRNKEQLGQTQFYLSLSWIAYVALFAIFYCCDGISKGDIKAENLITFLAMFPFSMLILIQMVLIAMHLHLMGIHLAIAILIALLSWLPHIYGQMILIPLLLLASRIQLNRGVGGL